MNELTCTKCKYTWMPRIKKLPVACPNCNSRKWNEPQDSTEFFGKEKIKEMQNKIEEMK